MNGVRRFFGASSSSTADPDDHIDDDDALNKDPQPPKMAVRPLSIKSHNSNNKRAWPPPVSHSPDGTDDDSPSDLPSPSPSPPPTPGKMTAGLFIRKSTLGSPARLRQSGDPVANPPLPPKAVITTSPSSGSVSFPVSPPQSLTSLATSPARSIKASPPEQQPQAGPSSPRTRQSVDNFGLDTFALLPSKRSSVLVDTRDELLMSLLASEAVVDSREYQILGSEEIEDLKREHQLLSTRLNATKKRLTVETKIRDAAATLSRVNAAHKKVSKQTTEQLETSNKKVETAQRELWRVSEQANDVQRRLLEHRAGVLTFSIGFLETKLRKYRGDSDNVPASADSSFTHVSRPGSATTSASMVSRSRFDGPHLFAGNASAQLPSSPKAPLSREKFSEMEERLRTMSESLANATQKQLSANRDREMIILEKERVETSLREELEIARQQLGDLNEQLSELHTLEDRVYELSEAQKDWARERDELNQALAGREAEIDRLESRLEVLEEQSGESTTLKSSLARLKEEHLGEIRRLEGTVEKLNTRANDLESQRNRLETDVKNGYEARERLLNELEDARRQRENARSEVRSIESRMRERSDSYASRPSLEAPSFETPRTPTTPHEGPEDYHKLVAMLKPIWSILPSPEQRAKQSRSANSPTPGSPLPPRSPLSSSGSNSTSIADMDYRALKALYESRPTHPNPDAGPFSIDAFASRVRALVQDDRALIERLIRFAQAHDLLKKNAERAQKLAQESTMALETYQRQVKSLEDATLDAASQRAQLMDEIHELQQAALIQDDEKRALQRKVQELTVSVDSLTTANKALSTRALNLAAEAASAPEAIRTRLEAELRDARAALKEVEEENELMRSSEQSQSMALMEELNSVQTENGRLREQLRAELRKQGR